MAEKIICPNCNAEIEITEAISSQLEMKIRREFEAELNEKKKQIEAERKNIEKQKQQLDELKNDIDQQVQKRIQEEKKELLKQAREQAKEDLQLELKDQQERLNELQDQLKLAKKNELELRKKERELQEKTEALELEIERKLAQERDKIRKEAQEKVSEEYKLKEAEKDKKIKDLLEQIEAMKRRAEQGSQQLQGEILELELERMLANTFTDDIIAPVPKGIKGADVIQTVKNAQGQSCGIILWESKRTKVWTDKWLGKFREDQRRAKANFAVLVTTALPKNVKTFDNIDGVWVCHWSCAVQLASVLRMSLLETAKIQLALAGKQGKMEQVYDYLTSPEFRHRVTGILEPVLIMKDDFEKEKRAIQKQWAKREKQLEQIIATAANMYGDFQGIIGGTLPEIKEINLLQLEDPKMK